MNTNYFEIMRQQARQVVKTRVSQPRASLGIGAAERIAPVGLLIPQRIAAAQPKPVVRGNQNRDQYENIKVFAPITPDSFPYSGGGL